jgi:type III restriction enzyme
VSPAVVSPAIVSTAVVSTAVVSPAVVSPAVVSPAVVSPAVVSPAVVSPAVVSPAVASPAVVGVGFSRPQTARPWLFPQLLAITKRWLAECLTLKDHTFPQLLMLAEFAHDASDRIYQSIVLGAGLTPLLKPILRPYDVVGSTRYVDFDTIRPVWNTRADKCHVSHVVADTGAWEQKLAQVLEELPEVRCYVKNHNLGLTIPYTLNGDEHLYYPDFLARVDDGHGTDDLLNLLLEVSGEERRDKAAKVATARTLWVPAVNNHGGFGRWAFVEITDVYDAIGPIRAAIDALRCAAPVATGGSGC